MAVCGVVLGRYGMLRVELGGVLRWWCGVQVQIQIGVVVLVVWCAGKDAGTMLAASSGRCSK